MLGKAVEIFVPRRVSTKRPGNKPWYTSYLCRLRRLRDRLFQRSKRLNAASHLVATYQKVRNWYVKELRHAERIYYFRLAQKLATQQPSSRWWSIAKSACGLKA